MFPKRMKLVTDLHERFDGQKESMNEILRRNRKEKLRKKAMGPLGVQNKPNNSFKAAH